MDKYSLSRVAKLVFESLKVAEIEEVLDDPIFFFRENEELLSFIKRRIKRLENKYLKKKKSFFALRRVHSNVMNKSPAKKENRNHTHRCNNKDTKRKNKFMK
jgi:hypothetical protein